MRKQIMLVQVPMHEGFVQKLKKSAFAKRLKKTAWMQRLHGFYHATKFYKNYKTLDYGNEFKDYICKLPFEYAEVTNNGELSACCYLPRNFGNAYKGSFRKAWNSFFAKKVRKSMLDGSFRYCDKTRCRSMQYYNANLIRKSEVQDGRLKNIILNSEISMNSDVRTLSLGMDYTCNLECPSCRTGMRKIGKDEVSFQLARFNSIKKEIGSQLDMIHISGDPLSLGLSTSMRVKCIVDALADVRLLGGGAQGFPAIRLGHPEHVDLSVGVAIFEFFRDQVGRVEVVIVGRVSIAPRGEGVRDVLDEDQPEDQVLVFGGVHVGA